MACVLIRSNTVIPLFFQGLTVLCITRSLFSYFSGIILAGARLLQDLFKHKRNSYEQFILISLGVL